MTYAVVEIAGRQYLVEPGKEFLVNRLVEHLPAGQAGKKLECDRVLMLVDGTKVQVGRPYLKEKLSFDVIEEIKDKKIRVAKFHAKASYRKVRGSRAKLTRIKLSAPSKSAPVKSKSVKKA